MSVKADEAIKTIKGIIKDAEKEERYLAVCGPSYKNDYIRFYAYGGSVLTIGLTDKQNWHVKYMDKAYDVDSLLIEYNNKKKDRQKIGNDYWKIALPLAKKRFGNSERDIQVQILRKYNLKEKSENKNNNIFCDMEFRVHEDWKIPNSKDSSKLKRPKIDLIVYDEINGIGLIELKYNEDNDSNLVEHYNDYEYICDNRKSELLKEITRRLSELAKYDLVDDNIIKKIQNNPKVWIGFLFVGYREYLAYKKISQISKGRCKYLIASSVDDIEGKCWIEYNK